MVIKRNPAAGFLIVRSPTGTLWIVIKDDEILCTGDKRIVSKLVPLATECRLTGKF